MTQVTVSGIDLCELLTLCQNPQRRVEAEKQLEVLQNTQPFQLFPGLAMILAGEDKQPFVRQLAGLVLKNSLLVVVTVLAKSRVKNVGLPYRSRVILLV